MMWIILILIVAYFIFYLAMVDEKDLPTPDRYCKDCRFVERSVTISPWYDLSKSVAIEEALIHVGDTCLYEKIKNEKVRNPVTGKLEYQFPKMTKENQYCTECNKKNSDLKCKHFEKERDIRNKTAMIRKIKEYDNDESYKDY